MFAVFLLKVRVNKALLLCATHHICAPRHYLVYLQENKVMQDRTGFTAHVVARNVLHSGVYPGSITLRQDIAGVIPPFRNETHLGRWDFL